MDATTIDKEIKRIEPKMKKGTEEHWAYRFLLSALVKGPSLKDLTSFWGLDNEDERFGIFFQRAKANGVFIKRKLNAEIYEDGIGLALGVTILLGLIKRAK